MNDSNEESSTVFLNAAEIAEEKGLYYLAIHLYLEYIAELTVEQILEGASKSEISMIEMMLSCLLTERIVRIKKKIEGK